MPGTEKSNQLHMDFAKIYELDLKDWTSLMSWVKLDHDNLFVYFYIYTLCFLSIGIRQPS